jgi:DNA replication protein DnaC
MRLVESVRKKSPATGSAAGRVRSQATARRDALAQLDFIDRNEVIYFLGPPGTGKSHLAIAHGIETAKAGRSVYFATLADIVGALAKAERERAIA